MTLRIAALFGRDPTALRTSAGVLALRRVHPTVDAAEAERRVVGASPLSDKPPILRPLRLWHERMHRLLVFGGFMVATEQRAAARHG